MNNKDLVSKLKEENKFLREQLEEINKTTPILIYDKNPTVWEFAKKELFTKYYLVNGIYYFFLKSIITFFFTVFIWKICKLNAGVDSLKSIFFLFLSNFFKFFSKFFSR
ncbi:MAG: hypothetical protein AM1032_000011 [Mycoplasmataceae bacterium]|nr:MAG: hypothetical protein AM1032_000011 [Mycoplasmataceae bacterium]